MNEAPERKKPGPKPKPVEDRMIPVPVRLTLPPERQAKLDGLLGMKVRATDGAPDGQDRGLRVRGSPLWVLVWTRDPRSAVSRRPVNQALP